MRTAGGKENKCLVDCLGLSVGRFCLDDFLVLRTGPGLGIGKVSEWRRERASATLEGRFGFETHF